MPPTPIDMQALKAAAMAQLQEIASKNPALAAQIQAKLQASPQPQQASPAPFTSAQSQNPDVTQMLLGRVAAAMEAANRACAMCNDMRGELNRLLGEVAQQTKTVKELMEALGGPPTGSNGTTHP